jgi:hypothetical protein
MHELRRINDKVRRAGLEAAICLVYTWISASSNIFFVATFTLLGLLDGVGMLQGLHGSRFNETSI